MVNHPNRSRADGPKITKHKDPAGWRVYIGGQPTQLLISRGDPPRYREPQMYNLWTGEDEHLLEAPGIGAVMKRVESIHAALALPNTKENG